MQELLSFQTFEAITQQKNDKIAWRPGDPPGPAEGELTALSCRPPSWILGAPSRQRGPRERKTGKKGGRGKKKGKHGGKGGRKGKKGREKGASPGVSSRIAPAL